MENCSSLSRRLTMTSRCYWVGILLSESISLMSLLWSFLLFWWYSLSFIVLNTKCFASYSRSSKVSSVRSNAAYLGGRCFKQSPIFVQIASLDSSCTGKNSIWITCCCSMRGLYFFRCSFSSSIIEMRAKFFLVKVGSLIRRFFLSKGHFISLLFLVRRFRH